MESSFEELRKKYNDARNIERSKIIEDLRKHDFKVSGRQGSPRYTSRRNISPYNLGIWKWIVVRKNNFTAVINLQTIEQDSKTKNIHALFDRVSIDVFRDENHDVLSGDSDSYLQSVMSRYNVENIFDPEFVRKTITNLELPLCPDEIKSIREIIEKKIIDIG
ncbi:hypothetical protein [Alloscardovia criceti]|uniref:hypothetical protein n=1 Tax=Alloscardovia criceti TaxID=356828 RepID=UPI000366F35C|nr:hypothetical protein [Alloscardovia criceti]